MLGRMRALGYLVFWLLLIGVALLFLPGLKNSWRAAALLREPVPTAGSLPNPLPGQSFIDTWGAARSGGRTHEGIDIFAPRGTPIRSTTHGVVLSLGKNTLGGLTVMVLGPGGQRHYYAHLDRYPDLTAGEWVEQGDVVGYVGNTGNARTTPPHLHYGIYTGAGAINPYGLLQR